MEFLNSTQLEIFYEYEIDIQVQKFRSDSDCVSGLFASSPPLDDTIFFGKCNVCWVAILKWILSYFELCSGLEVNFHKFYNFHMELQANWGDFI